MFDQIKARIAVRIQVRIIDKLKAIYDEAKRKLYVGSPEYLEARADREFLIRIAASKAESNIAVNDDSSYAQWLRQVNAVKRYRAGNLHAASQVLH